MGWGYKFKRDDDLFSKSNGYMEIYEEVMSFFFFRIKDFDLDLLKWCWNENDFVECLDIYKIIFVWKILVLF